MRRNTVKSVYMYGSGIGYEIKKRCVDDVIESRQELADILVIRVREMKYELTV